MMESPSRGGLRPLSIMFDDYTAMLVSVSAVVYLLRALPPLLAPSGLLGGVIYLGLGLLIGITLAAAAVYLIFLSCTEHKPPTPKAPPASSTITAPTNPTPAPNSTVHPLSITPRLRAATSALLQYRKRGRYSGTVYLVPASRWPRESALDDFPPPTSGPKAVATKWHAKLRATTLTLAQEVAGRRHKVYINLEGCEVSIVREGLAAANHSRTVWWKKAPLEVAHPDRPLLFGESSLMLFAEHGGAKEQWYLALQWATTQGGLAKGVADLYATYCAHLRTNSGVHLPRPHEAASLLDAADSLHASQAASQNSGPMTPRRRGWFRGLKAPNPSRGTSRRRMSSGGASALSPRGQLPPASTVGSEHTSPRPPGTPSTLPMMDPDELERRWMSSRRPSSSAATPVAAGFSRSSQGSQGGAAGAGGGLGQRSTGEAVALAGGEDGEVDEDTAEPASTQPQRRRPPLTLRISDPASPTSHSQPLPVRDGAASPAGRQPMRRSRSQPAQYAADDGEQGGSQAADTQEEPSTSAAPPPPTMPALYGVNMFLARAAFELLRSKPFEARLQEMIQRKLGDIRRPAYIQELTLSCLDLGATVPLIKSAHSLPPTTNAIWPQVQLEISYQGTFALTIETKLDLHKAPAFGRIERTLHHIRGPSRTQEEDEIPANIGPEHLPPGTSTSSRPASPGQAGSAAAGAGGGSMEGDRDLSSGEEGEDDELTEAVNSGARERLASQAEHQLREGEQLQAGRRKAPLLGVLRSGYKALRRAAVDYAQQGLHNVAKSLSLIPFQLDVHVTRLEGKVLLWVPPPPSDRLWFAFVEPPDVDIRARPIIGNRVLKHSITFMLNRVSDWFERKLLRALRKNLVLPACGDIRLGAFASLEASLFARHLSLSTHPAPDQESDSSAEATDSSDGEPGDDQPGPLPPSSPLAGAHQMLLSHSVALSGELQSIHSDGRPSSPVRPKNQPQPSMSLTLDRPPPSALVDRPTPSALMDPHLQAELHMRLPLLSRSGPGGSSCSSSTLASPTPSQSSRGSPQAARSPGAEASGPLAAIARRSKKIKEKKERRKEERQQRERQQEQEAWDRGETPPPPPPPAPSSAPAACSSAAPESCTATAPRV